MKIKCVVCDVIVGESNIKTNAPDSLAMLGFCPDHQPEPEPERDIEAEFEEANRRILQMDIYDADNNLVPKIIVVKR